MKRQALTILILFNSLFAIANPFGTVKLNDSTYYDETEITIGSWLSYYSWTLEHEGYKAAQKLLPDSNSVEPEVWRYINTKSETYNDRIMNTGKPIGFFKSNCIDVEKFGKRLRSIQGCCSYIEFPITGLTYEQVIEFCKWRTSLSGDNKYRLPTIEEWENLAFTGLSKLDRPKRMLDSLYKGSCPDFNYNVRAECDRDTILGKLNGVGLFSPSELRVFDIFGNVSEMTLEKGIAKGGNFRLFANQCHIDSNQYYTKPSIWLGFRCIVVKKKTNQDRSIYKPQNKSFKDSANQLEMDGKFGEFIDYRDNTKYKKVKIGNQIWFAENLKYKPDSGKYWIPEKNNDNILRYGYVYNWETAKNVCPVGWHLPSKNELDTLIEFVGGNETESAYIGLLPSGSTGFSLQFAGSHIGVNYVPSGLGGIIWSSTESKKRTVWCLGAGSMNKIAGVRSTFSKKDGFSVRCIKD